MDSLIIPLQVIKPQIHHDNTNCMKNIFHRTNLRNGNVKLWYWIRIIPKNTSDVAMSWKNVRVTHWDYRKRLKKVQQISRVSLTRQCKPSINRKPNWMKSNGSHCVQQWLKIARVTVNLWTCCSQLWSKNMRWCMSWVIYKWVMFPIFMFPTISFSLRIWFFFYEIQHDSCAVNEQKKNCLLQLHIWIKQFMNAFGLMDFWNVFLFSPVMKYISQFKMELCSQAVSFTRFKNECSPLHGETWFVINNPWFHLDCQGVGVV